MQSIDPDYLKDRAEQLGLGRIDTITRVQTELDKIYPGKTHVTSLNRGALKIVTPSAAVASELRLNQTSIMALAPEEIERLQIVIG